MKLQKLFSMEYGALGSDSFKHSFSFLGRNPQRGGALQAQTQLSATGLPVEVHTGNYHTNGQWTSTLFCKNLKFLIGFLLIFASLFGQSISDYAYSGARSAGMCGATAANPGSAESVFHNPAGLAEMDELVVEFNSLHLFGLNNLPSYTAQVVVPGRAGNFAFMMNDFVVENGSTAISSETAVTLSHAFDLQNDLNSTLSVGYNLNFIHWNLGESAGPSGDGSDGIDLGQADVFSFDVGFTAILRERHRIAVFLKNANSSEIGKGLSSSHLPRRMSIALSYTPYKDVVTSFEMDRQFGLDVQYKSGFSYRISKYFELRAGAQNNPNRLSAGFGLSLGLFEFNYAALSHAVLPLTQQFSLSIQP